MGNTRDFYLEERGNMSKKNSYKPKLLVFHPALAPYRVDFFNSLNTYFDATFYFFIENLISQKFDQNKIKQELNFKPEYLNKGFNLFGRFFRFGVSSIIKKVQPDIIICTEFNLVNFIVFANLFFSGKKFKIYTICDDNVFMIKETTFLRKLSRFFLMRLLDGIIVTHHEVAEFYKTKFKPKGQLLVFPIMRNEQNYILKLQNSIPIAKQYIEDFSLKGKKVLLFVGRFAKEKNLERLLDAFKIVYEKHKETVLVLVGSGQLENILKEKIVHLGLCDCVITPGRFEGEALLGWYLSADIFVLPSIYEPFGAVINEALLAGCFVLISNLAGGTSLVKKNTHGYLFDPYNINQIAEVIQKSLNIKDLFKEKGILKNSRMFITYKQTFDFFIHQLNKH